MQPDAPRTATASGLALVEHRKPETSGTVVAVGPCPHPFRHEAAHLADRLVAWAATLGNGWMEERERVQDAADLLLTVTAHVPSVHVGDRIVFSWQVGQEVLLNDETRYLVLREADVLAVVEPEGAITHART